MLVNVPSSFRKPNGVWEHHIRQSDLERFNQCPELHRKVLFEELKSDREGDAAIIGTACHKVYKIATEELVNGTLYPVDQLCDLGIITLDKLWNDAEEAGTLSQMQIPSLESARLDVCNAVIVWFDNFYTPMLATNPELIQGIEHQFDIKVWEDFNRIIFVSGTYDLKYDNELYDYKHSRSAKYTKGKVWQLSRYAKQPTHYALADAMETSGAKDLNELRIGQIGSWYFSFVNINPAKKSIDILGDPEGLTAKTFGDFGFHLAEMLALCELIEAPDLSRWPLGARDWWCSPKWCPAWSECRGAFLGDDPWGLLAKVEVELGKKK